VFLAVNGVRKAKWDLEDFVTRVRGPVGTKVTLEVKRGTGSPFSVVITRDRIVVPNTETKTFGADVAYIRLMSFNEPSAGDVRTALAEADKKGAKGYILDLRGNPGGLLTSSVDVASLFVPSGAIVRVDERGAPEKVIKATGAVVTSKPLVVLVDVHSASASEIVAGALQDYGRAVIVGETTYGKGSVQTMLPLKNGGGVKLTTAHYLTPKKRVINGKGVVPDVVVKMDPRLQETSAGDTQLQRAITVLRARF
jgi:carboxyl-terminal processing protease